jgi:hypothetical protein
LQCHDKSLIVEHFPTAADFQLDMKHFVVSSVIDCDLDTQAKLVKGFHAELGDARDL